MQTRMAEHLGDLGLAPGWAKCLKVLYRAADEVRGLVDGLADPDKRVGPFLVDASYPG
jgi:hypothetical protein